MTTNRPTWWAGAPTPLRWSGAADGYFFVRGLYLEAHSLGEVTGDDAHCRAVCERVGGCNTISRKGDSTPCMLDTACPGGDRLLDRLLRLQKADTAPAPTIKAVQRRHSDLPLEEGAVTMFATRCRPAPEWHRAPYILKEEGAHLSLRYEASVERKNSAGGTSKRPVLEQAKQLVEWAEAAASP